jgi:hypothetical protein
MYIESCISHQLKKMNQALRFCYIDHSEDDQVPWSKSRAFLSRIMRC